MLERVGQSLLHNPIGGNIHGGCQRPLVTYDSDLNGELGIAHRRRETRELTEAGERTQILRVTFPSQEAEEPVKLEHRYAISLAKAMDRRKLNISPSYIENDETVNKFRKATTDVVGGDAGSDAGSHAPSK